VKSTFQDRINEIEIYFELVNNIEIAAGSGCARFKINDSDYQIKPQQQKMMYSGIYLQLYNLVELTITMLLEAVERNAAQGINGELSKLSNKMKKLYVKSVACPNDILSNEKRFEKAMDLFEQVMNIKPIELKIPSGGGGNWDTIEISRISETIGVEIRLPKPLNTKINKAFRNDKKPIWLIKEIRNKLAHGSLSFSECGENHVASDFRNLIDIVKDYLNCVINAYETFINNSQYKEVV
jgi:hypothetical protein